MNQEQFEYNVALASFIMGIMNYQENLTQNDKSEILQNSQNVSDLVIQKIDSHLQIQDQKIDQILQELETLKTMMCRESKNLDN